MMYRIFTIHVLKSVYGYTLIYGAFCKLILKSHTKILKIRVYFTEIQATRLEALGFIYIHN